MAEKEKRQKTRYAEIFEAIFQRHYKKGATEITFKRDELVQVSGQLGIKLPKNLGDLIYSFRYRVPLPEIIVEKASEGYEWIIEPAGPAVYRLVLTPKVDISPNSMLMNLKIPEGTPGIISRYALSDEQSLLAKIRYNRLIDIFSGVTCYSMQNHLRTAIKGIGQVETDEIYVGVDKHGVHYVFPVQAKTRREKVGIVQIKQDFAICEEKFPGLICRPMAAQFMIDDTIVLFEFVKTKEGIRIATEKHYKLVSPDNLSSEELEIYRKQIVSND